MQTLRQTSRRAWSHPDLRLLSAMTGVFALLFLVGVLVEHASTAGAAASCTQQRPAAAPCAPGEAPGAGDHDADAGAGAASAQPHPETVLGIPLEDPATVAAIVASWIVLGATLLILGYPFLPSLILVAALATVFDLAELVRQVGEARYGVAALAALVTLGHAALVALGIVALRPHGPERISTVLQTTATRLSSDARRVGAVFRAPGRRGP